MIRKQQVSGGCPPELFGGASRRWAVRASALVTLLALTAASDPPAWTQPQAPFEIAPNLYYVGSRGIAAYVIKTSAGAILIDGTLAENAPMIERNLATVGVRLHDVKYLLVSHAHFDHVGALARLRRDTGANVIAGAPDRGALEAGRPPSDTNYGVITFPAVPVARAVADGTRVRLGGTVLTARLTPGHTPGCTTWTMRLPATPRPLDVVFPCSMTVAGNHLAGNRGYPGIVADYRLGFARLASLHADIVLPAHPEVADVIERGRRKGAGDKGAFIDSRLLGGIVERSRGAFEAELARQKR